MLGIKNFGHNFLYRSTLTTTLAKFSISKRQQKHCFCQRASIVPPGLCTTNMIIFFFKLRSQEPKGPHRCQFIVNRKEYGSLLERTGYLVINFNNFLMLSRYYHAVPVIRKKILNFNKIAVVFEFRQVLSNRV